MQTSRLFSRILSVLPGVLLAFGPLSADPLDELFDPSKLHDVQITMSATDWSRLRSNYQQNTYYDADITFDGQSVSNVAIRSRGSGTRNPIKPGLRVDFNRNVDSQEFLGLHSLVLDNMYNDPSFLREQLSFSVFREIGIPVPRESFARLTINGAYWGLYAIIEEVEKIFIDEHLGENDGNLFDYEVPPPPNPDELLSWDFSLSRGDSVEDYVPVPFDPQTNESDLDGTRLLEFIRTVTEAPDETFVTEISKFVDPYLLLTYLAVEVATSEIDGLTSPFGTNNFYLYQMQDDRFLFIPWDHDFGFISVSHPIYYGVSRNRLIARLLADDSLLGFYRETLLSVIDRHMNAAWMLPRIDAFVALIRDSVLEDQKRKGGDDNPAPAQAFEEAVEHIRRVVTERGASVDRQLNPPARQRAVRR